MHEYTPDTLGALAAGSPRPAEQPTATAASTAPKARPSLAAAGRQFHLATARNWRGRWRSPEALAAKVGRELAGAARHTEGSSPYAMQLEERDTPTTRRNAT